MSNLRIDWIACEGRGACAELAPEVISEDPWGYPIITPGSLPDAALPHVRRAVAACPALALRLVEDPRKP
jgi:ferredoxin